jgi:hypothetical protein
MRQTSRTRTNHVINRRWRIRAIVARDLALSEHRITMVVEQPRKIVGICFFLSAWLTVSPRRKIATTAFSFFPNVISSANLEQRCSTPLHRPGQQDIPPSQLRRKIPIYRQPPPFTLTQVYSGLPQDEDSNEDLLRNQHLNVTGTPDDEAVIVMKKRKKRSGRAMAEDYKIMDQKRDALPFLVSVVTPNPYTPESIQKQKSRPDRRDSMITSTLYIQAGPAMNSNATATINKNSKKKNKSSEVRKSASSSADSDYQTKLGDYVLDKYTTTGDLLEISGTQYRVVRHRCLYKYAGNKQFVMTSKILEVKEIQRVQQEEYLQKSWKLSASSTTTDVHSSEFQIE